MLTEVAEGDRKLPLPSQVRRDPQPARARLRHPQQQIQDAQRRVEAQGRALDTAFKSARDAAQARFQRWGDLLESYSYRGVLKRGRN